MEGRASADVGQQLARSDLQGAGDLDDVEQAQVALTAFDPANVRPMQVSLLSEFLLGQP